MAVEFEFAIEKGFHFAEAIGKRFGMPVADNRVFLPKFLGNGYIQEIAIREGMALCLHRYILEEDFLIRRLESGVASKMLTLRFDCRKMASDTGQTEIYLFSPGCEADLGTGNFFTEVHFPAHQEIYFLVINISRELLVELLQLDEGEIALRNRLLLNPSFVVNVLMSYEMEDALKEFSEITTGAPLSLLRYQAKTLELIYLMFAKLTNRADDAEVSINRADADKIYEIRSEILSDLSITPYLPELSKRIAMSPTKMKMLFRQIFGDTIYNYFQQARMNEAAKLLRDHSVAETGYQLGFTNMSHFSRLFEKHFKSKPKKFKDGGFKS